MSNAILVIGDSSRNKYSRSPESFKFLQGFKKENILNTEKNRFYSKVLIPNENNCMEWIGGKHEFGYGIFSLIKGKLIRAHRYSYLLHTGNIPRGMQVLHHCDNPSCVTPEHLYLGTDKENARDRINRHRNSPPPIRYGQDNNKSKLNINQKIQIINLVKQEKSITDIAKLFNVNKRLISYVKQGKYWKEANINNVNIIMRGIK